MRMGYLGVGLILPLSVCLRAATPGDWPTVTNDKTGMRYSAIIEINRQNVARLQVAWTYHTGDAGQGTTIECTPLAIDGRLYITTVKSAVACLDGATGKEIWRFDPYTDATRKYIRASAGVNRGVAYWSDGKENGQRRILAGLTDGRLISLDAATGKLDPAFGNNGIVDMRQGIEWDV